jgi:hypothetical protein
MASWLQALCAVQDGESATPAMPTRLTTAVLEDGMRAAASHIGSSVTVPCLFERLLL